MLDLCAQKLRDVSAKLRDCARALFCTQVQTFSDLESNLPPTNALHGDRATFKDLAT